MASFSFRLTILYSVLVAGLLAGFVLSVSGPPLDQLDRPAESLTRLVAREMDLRAALRGAPRWERAVYYVVFSSDEDALKDSVGWYDELTGTVESPVAELYRAILLAEAGQRDRAHAGLDRTGLRGESGADMAGWLRAGYLGDPPDLETGRRLLAEVRTGLPPGWFADILTARVAARMGDKTAQLQAESAIAARGETLLRRVRILTASEVLLLGLGAVVLGRLLTRRSGFRIGEAPLPPSWTIQDGYALFIRGAAGYLSIVMLMLFVVPIDTGFSLVGTLAAGAPMLWWTMRYLRARGALVLETFGLRPRVGGPVRLADVTVVVIGLTALGDTVVAGLAGALPVKTHWTEGFLEDVLWGSPWLVVGDTVDSILWTPAVEEIGFRGVLYGTLRTRMAVWPAALLGGAVFALAHGYGVAGFASVFWSGVLWALAYEHTRSLWPSIFAHSANNLTGTVTFLWLLRM